MGYFYLKKDWWKMGRKRRVNEKLITSRQLYRMIAQNQDLPMEVVQDVITALGEVVYLAVSEGYKVNINKLGVFNTKKRNPYKKGDIRKISKVVYDTYEEGQGKEYTVFEKDGEYYKKYVVDETPYFLPNFKFNTTFRDKCKERSKQKWRQQ